MIRVSVSPGSNSLTLHAGPSVKNVVRELRTAGVSCRRSGESVFVPFEAADTLRETELDLTFEPRAERAIANRDRVRAAAPRVLPATKRIQTAGAAAARSEIGTSRLVDRLDDHQAINVAVMTQPGGWGAAIFDEQGTGKTMTAVAAFDLLVERGEVDALIVVAPKTMVGTWCDEVEKAVGDLYKVVAVRPSLAGGRDVLTGADIFVMNYERAVSLLPNLELLARRMRVALVVDESFNVKNPSTIRSEALTQLREWCDRAFILCGTPAPNAPVDLLSQVDLIDFGFTFDGVRHQVAAGAPGGASAMTAALWTRSIYSRNLKRDVLPDLPGKTFSRVSLILQPKQHDMYRAALDSLLRDVQGSTATAFARRRASFLERRTTLLRICSNPVALDGGYDELPTKLVALDELLQDLVGAGEKVVLWSFYRASLDRLVQRYARFGVARVDGSINDVDERRDAVRRFQEDDDTMVFLGNPAAAGAGLTLHRARVAVYESMSNQAAHYLQSLDRIHRRGQSRPVEYITLLCAGTIEEVEYQRLLHKAEVQGELLGDPPDEPTTRDVMLAELFELTRRLRSVDRS